MVAMDTTSLLGLMSAALGVTISVLALLGLGYRFVLLPNLEKNLFAPVKETHHQVTVNHHSSDTPTLKDMIDDVRADGEHSRSRMLAAVADVRFDLSAVKDEVTVIRHTQDRVGTELRDHLETSEEARKAASAEQIAMWNAIGKIAAAPASLEPIEPEETSS
jgi:phosphopantothenoylcysteine synthetase/decarboxylase